MKTPCLILLALGIISLLIVSLYFMGWIPFEIEGCQNIYCADYEFICCGGRKDISGTWDLTSTDKYWQCPNYAVKCEVDTSFTCTVGTQNVKVGRTNCKHDILGTFKCDDDVTKTPGTIVLGKGDYIHGSCFSISYRVYIEKLMWCGDSSCGSDIDGIIGVPVAGASGCTFVTNWDVYNQDGSLKQNVQEGADYQITVPVGICYLSQKSRHICGDSCEKCSLDSDCKIGHTYVYQGKGAECSTGTLQIYGCKKYGTQPSEQDRQILPWESGVTYNFGSRCDVIQTLPVQCCPGTDSCGASAFCDPETFTCESTIECTYDWECGTAQTCTYEGNQPVIKGKKCVSGKCQDTIIKNVNCCYDTDCPSGWFCSYPDYTCKEGVDPRPPCPFDCCVDDPNYRNKPCPPNQNCVNHECVSEKECLLEGESCGTLLQKPCCDGLECKGGFPIIGGGECVKTGGVTKIPWGLIFAPIFGLIGFVIPTVSVRPRDRTKGLVIGAILGLTMGLIAYYAFTYLIDINQLTQMAMR